ncbi:hypothetical protein EOM81_07265 [bacterium]|nr:hypothetical protein [bacterium]
MLSGIRKLVITEESIDLETNERSVLLQCDTKELFETRKIDATMITQQNSYLVALFYENEQLLMGDQKERLFFFPHEMLRCIRKDFKRGRSFDLGYRKHLVYDYSREHFNVVIPEQILDGVIEKAKGFIRKHSVGKTNKPTGIILPNLVIVVKGDSHYSYAI